MERDKSRERKGMIVELLYDTPEVNASCGSRPCAHDSPFAEGWKVPLCCPQGSEPLPLCSSFDSGLSSTVGQVSNPHCSFLKHRSQTSSGQMLCFTMWCVCGKGACWHPYSHSLLGGGHRSRLCSVLYIIIMSM